MIAGIQLLLASLLPLLWLAGPLAVPGLEALTLAAQFLPWSALPLLVWALFWRVFHLPGPWAEVFGAEALLAAVAFAQPLPPAEPLAPEPRDQFPNGLTLMACNLGPRLDDCAARARTILDAGADVIAFQELWPAMAQALADEGAESHPHRAFYPLGMDGRGVLSRYPLTDVRWIRGEAQRELLVATVQAPFGDVELGAVHLAQAVAWAGPRDATARDLEAWLAEPGDAPRVFLGDFNSALNSPVTARLARLAAFEALHDLPALDRARRDATFPIPGRYRRLPLGPFVRLDQIWRQNTPPGWHFERAWVGPDTGSDHLPFLARLRVQ
ncbi:MAG: endonuclease/exonuclease/phosphatase family protein [Planctomycetota bacterium]